MTHSFRAANCGLRGSLLASSLFLAACSHTIPVPTTVATPGMPDPEAALRQSMQHVDAEMAELGQLSPSSQTYATAGFPPDLQRIVSFVWNGPLDDGVAKLAASVGYNFYTTGPASEAALSVAVQLSSVPAYQAFQALGAEAGTRATVQLDPQHHQVQVIHHV